MLTAWHTTGFGEVGGLITKSNLFGYFLGTQCIQAQFPEAQLPEDKLSRIQTQLTTWLGRKSYEAGITVSSWLTAADNQGSETRKTFVSRMYNTAARIKELHYYTTLTKALKSNMC